MLNQELDTNVNGAAGVSSGIRVFLVEDDALIRECLRAMLELEPDIEVVGEAPAACYAIPTLESIEVDVVLMDIGMPGIDGIEATRRLKERDPELTVVMLTSNQDDVQDAIEAGAKGYLMKACTSQQLIQGIKAAHDGQVSIDPLLTGGLIREMADLKRGEGQTLITQRQLEVLKLVADGTRYREIATKLSLS